MFLDHVNIWDNQFLFELNKVYLAFNVNVIKYDVVITETALYIFYFQFKNNIINIYLQQNNLLITYNHHFIYTWIFSRKHIFKSKTPATPQPTIVYLDSEKRYSMLEERLKNISINFCAEISNVVVVVKLTRGNSSSIGFNKLRLMLDQVQESRGE